MSNDDHINKKTSVSLHSSFNAAKKSAGNNSIISLSSYRVISAVTRLAYMVCELGKPRQGIVYAFTKPENALTMERVWNAQSVDKTTKLSVASALTEARMRCQQDLNPKPRAGTPLADSSYAPAIMSSATKAVWPSDGH